MSIDAMGPVAWKDTMHTDHADGRKEHEPMLLGYEGWEKLPDGTDLYTTPQPAIPDGMVLVPVEPTNTQVRAGQLGVTTTCAKAIYKAMVAAAPKPGEKE